MYDKLFVKENRWQLWFWGLVIVAAPVGAVLGNRSLYADSVFRFFGLFSKMAFAYGLAYWLIPRFFYQRKYWQAMLLLPLMMAGSAILARVLNVHGAERMLGIGAPYESLFQITFQQFSLTFNNYFPRVFSVASWFVFLKIGVDRLRSERKVVALRQEKALAELNFLKAQIHPHFLFNTLNNLYTLTLEKSDEAPEVVLKLSAMLDYLLYQCSAERVAVQKEIELLQNYIGLESLRYGQRLRLDFTYEIDDPQATVAPLLLLSPVENAFKHGASGATENPWISISLRVQRGVLDFKVANSKPSSQPTDERNYTAGIGLKNVEHQLQLTYPDQHTLHLGETAGEYTFALQIKS
ncbi:MAG: histidine kinase [Bacteroidota bacterium]